MADKKELPLAMARILVEYTDENHLLSTKELTKILENEYGLTAERRTIYANVEMLKEYGYDISSWQDNGKGYYLKSHVFSPEEAKWLIEKIQSDEMFTAKRKRELKKTLNSMLSKYQR